MGGRGRRWLLFAAVVLGAAASVLFLKPVLLAPVAGDDRVWYPEVASVESWSPAEEIGQLPEWWHRRTGTGRANVLTDVERRTAARAVVEASVATGTPTYVVNGALKLLIGATAVLSLAALLKSLRCRRRADGALVRLRGRTVVLSTLMGGVMLCLGGQAALHEVNGRNGWVNYPTHSFGAVLSILGLTALVLWLTRLYAEGRFRVPVVVVLALLAVLTNFRYELVFPIGPLVLIALLLVHVTPSDRMAEGRRAKWITGLSFVGVFTVVLVVLRVYVRRVCEVDSCYQAVTPRLSPEIVITLWQNVVSTIPGATATQTRRFVEGWGVSSEGMYAPTPWSVVVGGALAAALLAGWWAARPPAGEHPPGEPGDPGDEGVADGPDEARLLLLGAALCLLGALGAAGVMSLSVTAQDSPELGLPYRNVVITWAGLAWAVGLGVLALAHRSRRAGVAAWVALSVAVGVGAAFLLPANERSVAADRVSNRASEAAFAALVNGELGGEANAHRCRLVPEIRSERDDAARLFGTAFQRYWGQEFCRRRPGSGPGGDRP